MRASPTSAEGLPAGGAGFELVICLVFELILVMGSFCRRPNGKLEFMAATNCAPHWLQNNAPEKSLCWQFGQIIMLSFLSIQVKAGRVYRI